MYLAVPISSLLVPSRFDIIIPAHPNTNIGSTVVVVFVLVLVCGSMCASAFSWRDALVRLQLRDVDHRAALRPAAIAMADQTSEELLLRREELLLQLRSSARLDAASPLYGLWLVRVLRAERRP